MSEFKGHMRVPGVVDWPLPVCIKIDQDRIFVAAASRSVGNWPLKEVEIEARDIGFDVEVQGRRFFMSTEDDPLFALEVGRYRIAPQTSSGGGEDPDAEVATDLVAAEIDSIVDAMFDLPRSAPLRTSPRPVAAPAHRRIGDGRGRSAPNFG